MYQPRKLNALIFISFFMPSLALALPSDRSQPIEVTANSASFDERAGEAIYRGNIRVTQGTLEIKGDTLTLNVDNKGALTTAKAVGKPVYFQQQIDPNKGIMKGQANEVIFNNKDGSITLLGNASLKQDNASFTGPKIVYSITRRQVLASGNDQQRVQLIFPPSVTEPTGKTP